MKTIITILMLLSANLYASGCDHSDPALKEESILYQTSGDWSAYFDCRNSRPCQLVIADITDFSDTGYSTIIRLHLLNKRTITEDYLRIEDFTVNKYRQSYYSSCWDDYQRDVIGVDYKGMRFRSEKDVDYL